MSKLKKRILALGMALVMTLTMIPMFASVALADEASATIKVDLTVSNQGELAKANDGSVMGQKEVTVIDLDEDGKFTFDEALVAAHAAYNSPDGYTVSSGTVKKLWGVETTNTLFFINGKGLSTGVTADTIQDGDVLLASVNKDNTYWSDWYTVFDQKSVEATYGDEVTLVLTGYQGMMSYMNPDMAPLAGVTVKTADGAVLGATDESGAVTFQTPAAGEYIVTAEGTVEGTVTDWNLMNYKTLDSTVDGTAFASFDWDTYETFVAYTDEDHGDGPYPADEVKFIPMYDDEGDETEWESLHYLKSNQLIADCPIMAPATTLKVENECIELTVDNKYNMFKPTVASLVTSAEGKFLELTYASTSYDKAYAGAAKEAVITADPAKLSEREGEKYLIPVASTEEEFKVAFHSVKNKGWYDRIFKIDLNEKTLTTDTTGGAIVPDTYASDWDEEIAVDSSLGMFQVEATKVIIEDDGTVNIFVKAGNPSRDFPKIALIEQTATVEEKEAAAIIGTPTGDSNNNYIYEFSIPVEKLGEDIPISHYQLRKGTEEWHDWSTQHFITINSAEVVNQLIGKIQIQKNNEYTEKFIVASKKCWEALPEAKQEEDDGYFSDDTGEASLDDPRNQDEIGEKELLVVSFGTSFNGSRVATIKAVEDALAKAYPEYSVRRAFTAQIIINHIWARDGEVIDNMEQALERAVANNVKELIVQPTHLMHGAEYDELIEALEPYQDKMTITISEPLLGEVGEDATVINEDKLTVAEAIVVAACKDAEYADAAAAAADGTAIVLMGHGTAHVASITYEQMQTAMDKLGYENVFVGTVEGEPESTECSNVIAAVKAAGYTKVILRPLMVVAGDHANNDMADPEDEESWYSQFTADGGFTSVTCQIKGLGEIPDVQQLYVRHVKGALVEEINTLQEALEQAIKEIEALKEQLAKTPGWHTNEDGSKYYNDANGEKVKGWLSDGGKWYFMDKETGIMATGWVKDGKWYFMKEDGVMATGWVKDGETWYYMNTSGAMQTGWLKDGNTWYYLKNSGAMAANEWCAGYWLNANGSWTYQPKGSWKQDSTGWWFGDTSGWYAKSTTQKIDGVDYTFNAAGYWVQ